MRDGFTGMEDFKGQGISFNISIGMIGISIITDSEGLYGRLADKYWGVKVGLGYGGILSITFPKTFGVNGY